MIPDPCFAAIILTFALKEAEPSSMPLHAVSETRALAAAAQQDGPTMDDIRVFQSYRTPLFADTLSQEAGLMRSLEYDLGFRYLKTRRPDANHVYDTGSYVYVPGTFTGVWQGTYLVNSLTHTCCLEMMNTFRIDCNTHYHALHSRSSYARDGFWMSKTYSMLAFRIPLF
jgi:hypothetical protein